jgi:hypothetical protein
MEHPPYSPDLATNDLWLFPKIVWEGWRFQDIEDFSKKKKLKTAVKAIAQ